MQKKLLLVSHGTSTQVGDGFKIIRALPNRRFPEISPFIMLDHAEPTYIPPSDIPKGVDAHPHRGFETVSIVYQGALEHRDSAGNYGKLFAGDVQWMTAASGIVHEEKHEKDFSEKGGILEMIQLWVNLPAKDKMSPPKYQDISSADIPVVKLPEDKGYIRVIAGDYEGTKGAATTHTPLSILDARAELGADLTLTFEEDSSTVIYVLEGNIQINEEQEVKTGDTAFFHEKGTEIKVKASTNSKFIILNGMPINEPMVSYGPFVMNTQDEIVQAINDFNSGKMGRLN